MISYQIWIDIAKRLSINPAERIICPNCSNAFLEVRDTLNYNNARELERHIFCPSCSTETFLRITNSSIADQQQEHGSSSSHGQEVFRFVDRAINEVVKDRESEDKSHQNNINKNDLCPKAQK